MTVSHYRALVVVPTRNGRQELERLFSSLMEQSYRADVCVVDSSSTDGTFELALSHTVLARQIPVKDFNHGATRQMMVDFYPDYDLYIFLTQDAFLEGRDALENIIAPFVDSLVGAVYGRQLPHVDATLLARHARAFNYPPESRVKSLADTKELGIKTAFISNSFSAYRRQALLDAGKFPGHVILAEDMYVAATMLLKGWKVAYAADACAYHSHNYSICDEFRRYFDTGVFHAREPWIRQQFGQTGGEGKRYVVSELRYLGVRCMYLWPSSILRNILKLMGYKLGLYERLLPLWLKQRLSMHWRYWLGPFA